MDSKKRSWVKSIAWRVLGIILLGIISYMITGDLKKMTFITVFFHSIRLVLYYYHERLWMYISWGKMKHPLADLPVRGKLTDEDLGIIRNKLKSLGYLD